MVEVVNLVESLSHPLTMDSPDPPFEEVYEALVKKITNKGLTAPVVIEEHDLPVIDLSQLSLGEEERRKCKSEIAGASRDWGFFQVLNHGISREIVEKMREEQVKVFREPFEKKSREDKYLNFSAGSYRWGTPSPTCLQQLSWSEAFHVPLSDIISGTRGCDSTLSSTMEQFAGTVSNLAQNLAEILAEELGHKSTFFMENCLPSTCYLRMNRYPTCPFSSDVFGLIPHTDSDFLTILHQDEVGGLQLIKDGEWIAVKPNPDALIINIGDLFQAWSNEEYKSVQHRVVSNLKRERYSTAYFFCPSYDTMIESCIRPPVYRSFSFREFRRQVQEDVQTLGHKVGLPRFLA